MRCHRLNMAFASTEKVSALGSIYSVLYISYKNNTMYSYVAKNNVCLQENCYKIQTYRLTQQHWEIYNATLKSLVYCRMLRLCLLNCFKSIETLFIWVCIMPYIHIWGSGGFISSCISVCRGIRELFNTLCASFYINKSFSGSCVCTMYNGNNNTLQSTLTLYIFIKKFKLFIINVLLQNIFIYFLARVLTRV